MPERRVVNESRPCAVCGDRNEAAELSLRRERHVAGASAEPVGTVLRFPLCANDSEWASGLLEQSGRGLAPGETPLGMPMREAVGAAMRRLQRHHRR